MTKTLTFSLLAFIGLQAKCQAVDSITNSILTTKIFRYGIYQKFIEFKTNTPSITEGFKIEIDSGEFVRYQLYDSKGKKIRKVYGFSDGHNLFVNAKVYDQTNYFVPILTLGNLIYFEDYIGKRNAIASGSGLMLFGLVGGAVAYLTADYTAKRKPGWVIILPDDNGNILPLTAPLLKSLLKDYDFELYTSFRKHNYKKTYPVLIQYLLAFNKKNPLN